MSKQRNDRGKTPSGAQNVQPIVQNAVVPGKLMESDWNEILENESSEEFVIEVLNEYLDIICQKVFNQIIESRVQPFAIFLAKEQLVDTIQWQFLECDQGESDTSCQPSWMEDDEPVPSVTDSWAQGAVPVVPEKVLSPIHETSLELCESELIEDESHDILEPIVIEDGTVVIDTTVGEHVNAKDNNNITTEESTIKFDSMKESITKSDIVEEVPKESSRIIPVPPQSPKQKKKISKRHKKFKPYNGSLPSFPPISLTPVTDDQSKPLYNNNTENLYSSMLHSSESLLRTQYGRPPGQKEVVYDERGNVVYIQKMNINELPKQSIRTKFKIIDMSKETEKQLRLTSKHKIKTIKKECDQNDNVLHPISNSAALIRRLYADDPDVMNGLRTPLPPPMVDTIDVVEGVLIRDGVLSKHGPKNKLTCSESKDDLLQPVASATTRTLKVNEIVADHSPAIRSFNSTKPLPPIFS